MVQTQWLSKTLPECLLTTPQTHPSVAGRQNQTSPYLLLDTQNHTYQVRSALHFKTSKTKLRYRAQSQKIVRCRFAWSHTLGGGKALSKYRYVVALPWLCSIYPEYSFRIRRCFCRFNVQRSASWLPSPGLESQTRALWRRGSAHENPWRYGRRSRKGEGRWCRQRPALCCRQGVHSAGCKEHSTIPQQHWTDEQPFREVRNPDQCPSPLWR